MQLNLFLVFERGAGVSGGWDGVTGRGGLAVGIHCSDLALTLARCPPRWSVCADMCVSSTRFSESAQL